jgi:hypothetical protein
VQKNSETADRPRMRRLARGIGAVLFSAMLGASAPALAAHGGGGFHGGGFHGGGFHGGGFHGGAFHVAGLHGGHFYAGGFHHHAFYRNYGYGFYPGLGLGLAFGAMYPWGWGYYYPPYYDYYYPAPTASATWYYCANPAGYYPYVTQCYVPWQTVPAS